MIPSVDVIQGDLPPVGFVPQRGRHAAQLTQRTMKALLSFVFLALLALPVVSATIPESPLVGEWEIVAPLSPSMDRYSQNMKVTIAVDGDKVLITKGWGRRSDQAESQHFIADGIARPFPVERRFNLTTVYSGLHATLGSNQQISATLEEDGRTLRLNVEYTVQTAQGEAKLKETHTYRANSMEPLLNYTVKRDSRPADSSERYVFRKAGSMNAYSIDLEDNWEVAGDLQRQALLISLQGLANRDGANLYLVYPDSWQFNYSKRLKEWYVDDRGYTFTELKSTEAALKQFSKTLKGYVVWEKAVRNSLTVAFTVAGLEDAVVVTEEQIPLVESLGLKLIEDFRGTFTGMNDEQIYRWAKDRYWDRCSRKHLIWLGGHAGTLMKPGVADWGIAQRVFFQDLSTKPEDVGEYNLSKEFLADLDSDALIMGWHSYAKDRESDHVSLCSSFGLPVLGLHSNPNISFENQIGFSEGFEFKNNHNVERDEVIQPEKKVYLAAIQTDSIGIGAWLKPGRGEIPYAWEVTMNYSWLVPSLLEFFYSTATPNDYFIGALSGPGYMYPKSVPPKLLPGLIQRANKLMETLDLRSFDIMDYSTTASRNEWADLTLPVIDAYFENMPQAMGFVNGYVPANTYAHRDGRAMVSFEYYLSPMASEEEAVADLIELGQVNAGRPYFLLLHIRETNTIARVKSILDQLPDDYELVPLDVFLKMAGANPNFKTSHAGMGKEE